MRIRFGFTPRILNILFLMLKMRRRSLKIGRVGRAEGHNRLHPCHSKIVQLVRIDRALSIGRCEKGLPGLTMHPTILRGSFPPPKGAVAVNFPEILITSSTSSNYLLYSCTCYRFFFPCPKDRATGHWPKASRQHRRRVRVLRGDVGVVSDTPRLNRVRQLAVRQVLLQVE